MSKLECLHLLVVCAAFSTIESLLPIPGDANTLPVQPAQCVVINTAPAQPSSTYSFLQQTLAVPSISIDFYQVFGQEDLQNGPLSATLAKGARLVQGLDGNGNPSEYIEFGDISGTFGTPALNDQWFGHYVTFSDSTGDVTTTIIGDDYPTGIHDFHIGPSPLGTNMLIDYNDVLDIDEFLGNSVAMQVFLSNSNLTSGTFRSGTAAQNIQYQDPTANYFAWQNPMNTDANYPLSQSSFDPGSSSVNFLAQQIGGGLSARKLPTTIRRPFNSRLIRKPSGFRFLDDSSLRTILNSSNPLSVGKLNIDSSYAKVSGFNLIRFRDVRSGHHLRSNEISPDRQVWTVETKSAYPMLVGKRVFPVGTLVDYVIDAQSGILLRYTIRHS